VGEIHLEGKMQAPQLIGGIGTVKRRRCLHADEKAREPPRKSHRAKTASPQRKVFKQLRRTITAISINERHKPEIEDHRMKRHNPFA
jgi:hypothetical protein